MEEYPLDDLDKELDSYLNDMGAYIDDTVDGFVDGLPVDPNAYTNEERIAILIMTYFASMIDNAPFDEAISSVSSYAKDNFTTDLERSVIKGKIQEAKEILDAYAKDAVTAIRLKVLQSAMTSPENIDIEDLKKAIKEVVVKEATKFAQNTADTVMATSRAFLDALEERERKKGGDARWIYVGPRDSKNRPFCAAILDDRVAYTKSGVYELNAHPLLHWYVPPNVMTMCGGKNCRHVFLPITLEAAIKNGYEIKV